MIELRKIRGNEYEELYAHMKRDFPSPGELAPFHSIKRNLEKNIYDGFIITENAEDIGYTLISAPENLTFALITYFAIYPDFRSKGYGSEFLKIITSRYSDRILVIEVSNPTAAKTDELREEALRRVTFYERAGFRVIPTKKAKIFGVDMLIMASGSHENLNAREIMHDLYLPALGSKLWLKFIDIK